MKLSNIRLTTAALTFIIVALIIVIGVIATISSRLGEESVQSAIRAIGRPLTNTSAKLLFNPLYTLNLSEINEILGQYVDNNVIIFAAVYDDTGKRITQIDGVWSPETSLSAALTQQTIAQNKSQEATTEQYLILSTPISVGTQVIGSVEFVIDQTSVRNELGTTQRDIILVVTITLLIAASLFFVLISVAIRPLNTLQTAALRIGQGELTTPVSVGGMAEIASLATSLDAMRAELLKKQLEIQNVLSTLEERITVRTEELEARSNELIESNLKIQKRAAQFETIAEVMHSTASIKDLPTLLQKVTALISERFGFYHVGIFLTDQNNQYAILSAANSEGGQRMLARGHRLRVGHIGIVGNVTQTGEARIVLNVGEDTVYFNNPDLPNTHSEIAVPLRDGEKIIGALDVQSTESAAFGEEDMKALSTLADQISIAIQNARLFETTQQALTEAETSYRKNIREQWSRFTTDRVTGYTHNTHGTNPLRADLKNPEAQQAFASGQVQMQETAEGTVLAVPITLRNEVIGVLNVRAASGHTWGRNELDIAQAVAGRVAISAENARLLEETSSRAERERTVSEISNKIRSSNEPQTMLEIAMDELKRALGAQKVQILPYTPPAQQK